MRVSLANAPVTAGALLLLGLGACGAAHDADLFRSSGTLDSSSGARNSSGAVAYLDAGGASSGAGTIADKPVGAAGTTENWGGLDSAPPNGGASSGGGGFVLGGASSGGASSGGASSGGASSGGASSGGASGAMHSGDGGGNLSDCSQFGPDANYFEETQHCYLVVNERGTFAAAQAKCNALGAHLVTLANQAENQFAWGLHSEDHWLGASDGTGANNPSKGLFAWVTGEPFTYSNWSSNQPNTSDTNCGDSGLTGRCYEHCAFQWTGGERDGQWNDRFCLHTIPAICEWDSGK